MDGDRWFIYDNYFYWGSFVPGNSNRSSLVKTDIVTWLKTEVFVYPGDSMWVESVFKSEKYDTYYFTVWYGGGWILYSIIPKSWEISIINGAFWHMQYGIPWIPNFDTIKFYIYRFYSYSAYYFSYFYFDIPTQQFDTGFWNVDSDYTFLVNNGYNFLSEFPDVNSPLPTPTNLTQFIEMPDPEDSEKDRNYKLAREPIWVNTELGYKIGHFQSGSGIILEASVDTGGESGYSVYAEVFASGSTTPLFTDEERVNPMTGSGEILVPITSLPVWDYRWTMRVKKDGRESEVVEYGTNSWSETDFAIFDRFEPYPYGYRFHNNFLVNWILTGGIDTWTYTFPFYNPTKINGNKWDIFESAFDTTKLIQYNLDWTIKSNKMYLDAFNFLWLNEDRPQVFWWQCYWFSVSALMMKYHSDFLNSLSISQQVWTWTLWQSVEPLHTVGNNPENPWDNNGSIILEPILKDILTLQLSQASTVNQSAEELSKKKEPIDILQELKDYPDKNYVLGFWWKQELIPWKTIFAKHYVVPYKVEWNRIYYWDNNIQAPFRNVDGEDKEWSSQYLSIISNSNWFSDFYKESQKWISFDDLVIIDIDTIYNNNSKSTVIWFNNTDTAYSFLGAWDFYLKDALWRISWFFWWNILEQIPWVSIVNNGSALIDTSPDNNFKQIYLPQKMDRLTLHIEGTTDENYTLMIAGGDYYQKLEWVPTTPWQIDTFETTGTWLTINFDDSKTWTYSLLVDNFHDYWTTNTGTVYIDSTYILPQPQQYSINWTKVVQNTPDVLTYQIDTNNDGTYDTWTTLPSIYRESTEKKIYTLLHPQTNPSGNNWNINSQNWLTFQNSWWGWWWWWNPKQTKEIKQTQQITKNVWVYQSIHTTQTGTLTPKPQTSQNSWTSRNSQTTLLRKWWKNLYSTRFYREDQKQTIQKNKQTKTEPKEKIPPKLRTKIEIKTK
jgi:hypothetical protein